MSESRLNAARAALVDNEKLEDIARPHGWDKQTVGGSNETLEAEIAELEKRLVMLNKKLYEIQEILQIVTAAVPSA